MSPTKRNAGDVFWTLKTAFRASFCFVLASTFCLQNCRENDKITKLRGLTVSAADMRQVTLGVAPGARCGDLTPMRGLTPSGSNGF